MRIQGKYQIIEKIGEGNFSDVFKGLSLKTGEKVAIKMEKSLKEEEGPIRILKRETTILNYLGNGGNLPKIHWFGNVGQRACLILPFYEYSLYDWAKRETVETRLPKIDSIRQRMISILKYIHSKSVIHRDIKPHNFMVKDRDIYLIDFGLATFFKDADGKHVEDAYCEGVSNGGIVPIGTPNYISLFVHLGHTPSRRDDMISLEYVCGFLRGEEPDGMDVVQWKREQLVSADTNSSLKQAYLIGFTEYPKYL
jgi:serine/threonine protein kinase